jgi:hypothetical protein
MSSPVKMSRFASTYAVFSTAVRAGVPDDAPISVASGEYGYFVYAQNGSSV